jgi:hypothetical protein
MNYEQNENPNAAHGELGPDPLVETADGAGVLENHSQQVSDPAQAGAQPERIVTTSTHTLGRHIKSEDGFKVGARRHRHVEQSRKESEKAFQRDGKKEGKKHA